MILQCFVNEILPFVFFVTDEIEELFILEVRCLCLCVPNLPYSGSLKLSVHDKERFTKEEMAKRNMKDVGAVGVGRPIFTNIQLSYLYYICIYFYHIPSYLFHICIIFLSNKKWQKETWKKWEFAATNFHKHPTFRDRLQFLRVAGLSSFFRNYQTSLRNSSVFESHSFYIYIHWLFFS